MRSLRRLALLALACPGFVFLLAGCAEPPHKEMNQAQGALDAARAAGAAQFAEQEFRAAAEALDKSRVAVEQRDYRQALSHALDARERAQAAARAAADEKARLRAETDRALHTAELSLDKVRAALDVARRARVPARQLADVQSTVQQGEDATRAARAAMERDDYLGAQRALDGIARRLETVSSEIDAAVAARPPRRPARRSAR
jgi:hypothetical protein